MFSSAMDEHTCQRMREMRQRAAHARRAYRLAAARRAERRAARATRRALLARDAVQ